MGAEKDFAILLQQAMSRHGWTQKDMAQAIGVVPSTISNYLSGKSLPPSSLHRRIAEVLEVSLDTFAEIMLDLAQPPSEAQEMISLLRDLQAQTQRIQSHIGQIQSRIGQLEARVEALQNQLS